MSALEAPVREETAEVTATEKVVKTAEEKAAAKAAAAAKAKAKRDAMQDFLADDAPKLKTSDVPEGFDPEKHKPLKKTDFEEEHLFMLYKANEYDAKAKQLRKDAEQLQKLGSAEDRTKAKKLLSMQQRMQELARELAGDGSINLEEILGKSQLAALLGTSAPSDESSHDNSGEVAAPPA